MPNTFFSWLKKYYQKQFFIAAIFSNHHFSGLFGCIVLHPRSEPYKRKNMAKKADGYLDSYYYYYYYLNTLMIADLALCTPGMVNSLAIITGQLN